MESILTKAQALAREEERKRFLENWFNTQKGVVDTINSANKIFASIDKKFIDNRETFDQLNITLEKDNYLRSIKTLKIGCQMRSFLFILNTFPPIYVVTHRIIFITLNS